MVLDIMLLIFAGYGFYLGYSKGIIGTVFTFLAYTLGLVAGIKFAPAMTSTLEDLFNNTNPLMFLAGFLLSFVLIMIVIRTLAKGLEGVLKAGNINIINKMIGGAFISGIMMVIFSIFLWFGDSANIVNDASKRGSLTYPYLKPLPAQAYEMAQNLQPAFKDFYHEAVDMMDQLQGTTMERSEGAPNVFDLPDDEGASSGDSQN